MLAFREVMGWFVRVQIAGVHHIESIFKAEGLAGNLILSFDHELVGLWQSI